MKVYLAVALAFLAGLMFRRFLVFLLLDIRNWQRRHAREINVLSCGIVLPTIDDPRWFWNGRGVFSFPKGKELIHVEAQAGDLPYEKAFYWLRLTEHNSDGSCMAVDRREISNYGRALVRRFYGENWTKARDEVQRALESG